MTVEPFSLQRKATNAEASSRARGSVTTPWLAELAEHHLLLIGEHFSDWLARLFLRTTKGRKLMDGLFPEFNKQEQKISGAVDEKNQTLFADMLRAVTAFTEAQ